MRRPPRKRFHFFKIISPAIIQQKRLGLPKKFVRKFGKEISEVVVLTVPNGAKWHVELKEVEGEICLVNGWQEFVDYYSIGVWHFLVFGYDGSSCFHVLICDMSASEMEYPCHIKAFEEPNQENECQAPSKESESVESLNAYPPCPIRAESVKGVSNESDRHHASRMRHLKPKVKCEAPSMEASDSVEIVAVSSKCRKRKAPSMEASDSVEIVAVSPKCQKRKAPSKESESVESLNVSPPGSIRAESVKGVSNESDRHRTSTMRHLKPRGKCVAPSKEESDSVEIVDVSPSKEERMKLYNLVTKEVKKDFLSCNMVRSKANAYKPSLVSIIGGNGAAPDRVMSAKMAKKKVTLKSSDGENIYVDEAVAAESQTIKHMLKNDCADNNIHLPNVTSKILAKVIRYCKKHVKGPKGDEDLQSWDAEFVKVDQDTLFDLILAANYLNIKSLLDLTRLTVADMIKGKTSSHRRKKRRRSKGRMLNIKSLLDQTRSRGMTHSHRRKKRRSERRTRDFE